ncbi:MAG: sugar phosphate isomerase/epimerase family protein [Pirellula sp.]
MPGLRVGVQLTGLKLPFKQALHAAARMGADAVEIDARFGLKPSELVGTALRQVRKLLEDLNLRVASVRYPTRRGYECEDELDRRIQGTKQAMKMAYDLGASVVVNHVGQIPDSPEEPNWQILRTVLSDLGNYSQRVGAFLACETGAEPLEKLSSLIDSLPDGSVGVTLTPGNLFVNGFDLNGLPGIAKHVMLVHAKDGVPDRSRGRGTEVPLGRGMAEFPEIIAVLEEHHFSGYFVVENDNPRNPIDEIAMSVQFLKNI